MKHLSHLDLAKNQLQNAALHPLAGAPSAPAPGQVYFNSTDDHFYGWNGTAWVQLDVQATGGGDADTLDGQYSTHYLDRANHTGTDEISDVNGLQAALDAKAPLASPGLSGTPTAPTAAPGTDSTQLATTAFVAAALSALLDSAPAALDTLNELAAALGDDPNFATTINNALAARAQTYAADIGDGSTTQITVTHSLGAEDVVVTIREATGNKEAVIADWRIVDTNSIRVDFATAPATNAYRVVVHG